MKAVLLVCILASIGLISADYQSIRIDPIYDQNYPINVHTPFQLPLGTSVSQIRIHPYDQNYPSVYDALIISFDICYASKLSNGSFDLSTEVCSPARNPTYQQASSTQTLHLQSTEYITTVTATYSDWDPYYLVQLSFVTNLGHTVKAGAAGGNSYDRSYMSQYYRYVDNVVTFNNVDKVFAGFLTGDFAALIDTWVTFYWFANSAVCGDGIVQPGEQCDSTSVCCTSTCKFATAATVCRSVAGLCDVAESCTGSSDVCPTDGFAISGTPCGEYFGMCDVLLEQTCAGNSAQCVSTPSVPVSALPIANWTSFNVISFNTFTCNGGDVEGRLAVRNKATLSSFDLGLKLNFVDSFSASSLFVAGDASWSSGSLHPEPSQAFIGGNFVAPDYLSGRLQQVSAATATQSFDAAQTYYSTIQNELAALANNAVADLIFGDGLQITCQSFTDIYHLKVDSSVFNSVNWYTTVGCRFSARWVIDITGAGSVAFQGEPFPGIVERVIYNVLGSGRTITANNGVAGHILAPRNSYSQTQGVTYGQVVVGDALVVRQNNKPNCVNFNAVTISNLVMKAVQLGDQTILVADLSNLVIGDRICVNGDCHIVVSGDYQVVDGQVVGAVTVDQPFAATAAAGTYATVSIENPSQSSRDVPLAGPYTGTTAPSIGFGSDASLLVVPALSVLSAMFL